MKTKSIFSYLIVAIMAICLVGCTTEPANVGAVSTSIKQNTTYLATVISELESINSNDLLINEISPLTNLNYGYASTRTSKNNKVFNDETYTLKEASQIRDLNTKNNTRDDAFDKNFSQKNNDVAQNQRTQTNPNINNENNGYTARKTSYKPRFVNEENSSSFNRTVLDSYLSKVETLYNMCNDCVIANSELNNQKSELYELITDCQNCCNNLGDCKMTNEQISECNSLVKELKTCCNNLNNTKGQITKTTNSFKNLKNNFGANIDSLCEKYSSILDCVEQRILECKNASTCLDRLTTLINNCCGYNKIINPETPETPKNDNAMQNQNNTMQNNNAQNNGTNVNVETMQNTGINNGINNQNNNGINNGVGINNPINNNGINNNYGYNGAGVNNGVNNGLYNGYYGVPRNTDTYQKIYKNTDSYFPNKNIPQNNNYVNPNINNANRNINIDKNVNTENKTTLTPPPPVETIRNETATSSNNPQLVNVKENLTESEKNTATKIVNDNKVQNEEKQNEQNEINKNETNSNQVNKEQNNLTINNPAFNQTTAPLDEKKVKVVELANNIEEDAKEIKHHSERLVA